MTRRAQPRPPSSIIFQDPAVADDSIRGNPMTISRLLMKNMRETSGMSVKEIASLLNCSPANVSGIMKPGTEGSSLSILGSFAAACNCEVIVAFKRKS